MRLKPLLNSKIETLKCNFNNYFQYCIWLHFGRVLSKIVIKSQNKTPARFQILASDSEIDLLIPKSKINFQNDRMCEQNVWTVYVAQNFFLNTSILLHLCFKLIFLFLSISILDYFYWVFGLRVICLGIFARDLCILFGFWCFWFFSLLCLLWHPLSIFLHPFDSMIFRLLL